jgi:hypothetical protein
MHLCILQAELGNCLIQKMAFWIFAEALNNFQLFPEAEAVMIEYEVTK